MAPRPTFKKAVIAYTDDVPNKDRIPGWIQHAGGKVSKDLTDEVTHFIISSAKGKNFGKNPDKEPAEVRRRRTIYLMKYAWLEDSLSLNNRKPIDEINQKYTWDLEHARRVKDKRQEARKRIKKATKIAELEEAALLAEDQDVKPDSNKAIKQKKKVQIYRCGIKFDKALLDTERQMAMGQYALLREVIADVAPDGYRPYVATNGFVYMVTLVRDDIAGVIHDQYSIKSTPGTPATHVLDQHKRPGKQGKDFICRTRSPADEMCGFMSTNFERFTVSETTEAHYLEDEHCCDRPRKISTFSDDLHDGHCTPVAASARVDPVFSTVVGFPEHCLPAGTAFQNWEQHLPFSVYPLVCYRPLDVARVHIPKPFAYALQLYQSIDQPPPQDIATLGSSPSTYVSFASYLPTDTTSTSPVTIAASPVDTRSSIQGLTQPKGVHAEKTYYVLAHYTKKGKQGREILELAPRGSTWDFAYDAFRNFFRSKTGTTFDEAMNPSGMLQNRRDSGVAFSQCSPIPDIKEQGKDAAQDLPEFTSIREINDTAVPTLATTVLKDEIRRKPFRYVPESIQDLKDMDRKYASRCGEQWLPPHFLGRIQLGNEEIHENLQYTKDVDDHGVTTKPQYQVCCDEVGFKCECGQVAQDQKMENQI